MVARYHVLVDRKLGGTLTAAESSELTGLHHAFDAGEADATRALRAETARDQAVFDAEIQSVHSKMKRLGINLPDAANHTKTRTARGTQ